MFRHASLLLILPSLRDDQFLFEPLVSAIESEKPDLMIIDSLTFAAFDAAQVYAFSVCRLVLRNADL